MKSISYPHRKRSEGLSNPVRRVLMLSGIVLLVSGGLGCSTAPQKRDLTVLTQGELIERAMDPMRPVSRRIACARALDASGKRELEAAILAETPRYWGQEWRARLALLEVVGGPETVARLEEISSDGRLSQIDRAQRSIDSSLARIERRLEGKGMQSAAGAAPPP